MELYSPKNYYIHTNIGIQKIIMAINNSKKVKIF